jgi:hypothetical protein
MARAIWSGVLSFGLVSVPVELHAATSAPRVRLSSPGLGYKAVPRSRRCAAKVLFGFPLARRR